MDTFKGVSVRGSAGFRGRRDPVVLSRPLLEDPTPLGGPPSGPVARAGPEPCPARILEGTEWLCVQGMVAHLDLPARYGTMGY